MKLSILIPSRNEDTEILVGLDGWTIDAVRFDHPRVQFVVRENVGQRAMTNELALLSTADYVMKIDAHCSFSNGFDVKMLNEIDDKTILAPMMGVLDQASWTINGKKMTTRYCFDTNFVMQYDEENGDSETMCLQGSAWLISRENYFKWNVCDETLGSWGGQAAELGIKAFINGGVCKTTRNAYYGHVFRHSDKDFPYQRGDSPGKFATEELKRRYGNDERIKSLVKKFNYPADWKSVV